MTRYYARPEGSASKLKSYRDGARILAFMGFLFKEVLAYLSLGQRGSA